MTFDEFFRKKKINLPQLQSSEPALFMEFKDHYEQMGEKSFDHTKKYWFNQLRRRFPAPVELKTEKVVIENRLAEQTITDSLTEPAETAPSAGFKRRFNAAMVSKPAEEADPALSQEQTPAEDAPKPTGFKPRFKAGMASKPAEKADPALSQEQTPAEDAPKPTGFKPRFKAGMASKPAEETGEPQIKDNLPEEKPTDIAIKPAGFTPRFKMKPKE